MLVALLIMSSYIQTLERLVSGNSFDRPIVSLTPEL
jgi:hypothetical protein